MVTIIYSHSFIATLDGDRLEVVHKSTGAKNTTCCGSAVFFLLKELLSDGSDKFDKFINCYFF